MPAMAAPVAGVARGFHIRPKCHNEDMFPRAASVIMLALALSLTGLTVLPAHAGAFEKRAQRQLNTLGCDAGPVDGRIGEHTRTGIIRFQAANGIAQNGQLTKETRSRMYGDRQVRCDRRPVARSGTGRRVVISQRQNYVWLVRENGSAVAQGGMIDNTRVLSKGSSRVSSYCGRSAKIRMNSDYSGRLWLNHFVRFSPCGVGFHRIPVEKSSGNQIHPDWLLGTNLRESSGCIRLSSRLASQLWEFAGVGTRVVVVS